MIAHAPMLLWWLVFGFAVAAIAGAVLLAVLKKLNLRQRAYALAPQTHQEKGGTPTMGGLIFVAAFAAMLVTSYSPLSALLVFLIVACAAVGAVDDLLAMRAGGRRGLRASTKLLATALVAAIFMRGIDADPDFYQRNLLFHAGGFYLLAPHWVWLVLGILAITGTIHGVNLTDGLDGLAAGSAIPPLALFAALALQSAATPAALSASIAASVGAGACCAFLIFNRHPAKLFMGDTGSLALGALLSGVAILSGEMLLLVVAGGVFVAEALSVMAQVTYFKLTGGKRILRMSPLHHHFELLGWHETKVTMRFWLASAVCSLLGWAIVR